MEPCQWPNPGDTVVLKEMPHGLVDGLPTEDKVAIAAIIGKPVRLSRYDESGRAVLEFTDNDGWLHFIYVRPEAISIA